MRKKSALRTVFGLALALTMTFGMLHAMAEPAEAGFNCPFFLLGCQFSYIQVDYESGIACCVYFCPEDGTERIGPSWYI